MKTKRFNKILMFLLTFCLLAYNGYGQAYMLWDFEDWTSTGADGCTIETTNPDPDGGEKYLKIVFDVESGYNLEKDIRDINLETMDNPLLVFNYNNGDNMCKIWVGIIQTAIFEKHIRYFRSPFWNQVAIPLKEFFTSEDDPPACYNNGAVSPPIDWNRVTSLYITIQNGLLPDGSLLEVNIDNIFLKAESQRMFDFEDGIKPQELPEFTIETINPDTSGGLKYLKVAKSDIAQWTWIGAAEKQLPITNLSVYNKPLVFFLYNTGSKKGYLQVEVGDNANMKWGYSVGQLESAAWTSAEVSLFDVTFSNWATDPLDWNKVKYVKIGFTTGDLPAGSDYELSIDNIKLKESPVNYEPLLRDFTVMGAVNQNLAFDAGLFKSKFTDFEGDTLVSIKFTELPDAKFGMLVLDALPVNANQEILVADIKKLKFVPVSEWLGICTMKWTATDSEYYPASAGLNITISNNANWALNKPVKFSSCRFPADYANDGYMDSYWGSQDFGPVMDNGKYADTSWIYVDLGIPYEISSVLIYWEYAYAVKYNVEVSNDAVTWFAVDSRDNGDGELDRISFNPVNARYVRIYTFIGGIKWAPAIYELEVYSKIPPTSLPIEKVVFGKVDDAIDYTGFVDMNWDNDSIYLHFVIKDDSIVTTGNAWQVDNIEIYCDMDNSKRIHWPRNGSWMANDTTFDDNDYQFRLVPSLPWETNNSLAGVNQVYTRQTDGYDFELAIPWNSLMPGFVPPVGKEIGFDVLVSDNDATASDANRNQITWNTPTVYPFNDPSIWGTLHLSDTGTFESIPDFEKPTTPGNLTAITDGLITTLSWDASEDNRVVQYYFISHKFKNVEISLDTVLAQLANNSFTYAGLEDGVHIFRIKAVDIYWNESNLTSIKDTFATGIYDEIGESLVLYPNPVGDVIYLGEIMKEKAVVEIYNLSGQLMMTCRIDAGNKEINVATLPQGMYTLRFRDSKEVRIAKLIKN
jgi:hypothetical protein